MPGLDHGECDPIATPISDVAFLPAPPDLRDRGLLGWVSFRHGALRLDGVAVRRTREGRLVLSFPVRHDRAGKQHPIVRPLDSAAHREIEGAVLGAVADRLPGTADGARGTGR